MPELKPNARLPGRRSVWRLFISTVALLAGTLTASEGSAASPDSGTPLPLTEYRVGYADMVVDELHEQVFVSGGTAEDAIVVLDFEGNILGEILGMQGASGMVIEHTTLYVAMPLTETIDLIDTGTIELVDSYSVFPLRPHEVELAGGRIWFGYGCDGSGPSGMASVDPDTGTITEYGRTGYPFICPIFATTPANPDVLVATEAFGSNVDAVGSDVFAYDVSDENPVLLNQRRVDQLRDLTISPDGHTLFVASVTPKGILAFSLPYLSDAGSYEAAAWPTSIVATGQHLAAGVFRYDDEQNDILIFPAGSQTARNWYKVYPANIVPRGLQFKPDFSALFALSEGDAVVFHVLKGPTLGGSVVRLAGSASAIVTGNPVTLSGRLEFPFGGSTGNRLIDILRIGSDGFSNHIGTAPTDATGAFFFQDVPTTADTFLYRARWDGDADHPEANSASVSVTVGPPQATLAFKASASILGLGKSLLFTGQLTSPIGADLAGETVGLYRRPQDGVEVQVGTTITGGGGQFTFQDTPPRLGTWRYRVRWGGDADHFPATTVSWSVNVVTPKTTTLTLTTSRTLVRFGQKATLKVKLGAVSTQRIVSIYEIPVGGTKRVLKTGTLSGGRLEFGFNPSGNTTYEAEWKGDNVHDLTLSKSIRVNVQAVTKVRLLRGIGSDRSKQYQPGVVPRFRAKVLPTHRGVRLRFAIEKRIDGEWKRVRVLTRETGAAGSVLIKLPFTRRDVRYRIRAEFPADADHVGSRSAWSYLKRS